MAYVTTNPPRILSGAFTSANGPTLWTYSSSDAAGTVDGAGYITNGYDLGMKVGDLVIVEDTVNVLATMHNVHTVTTSSAADLGTGISVGSSANAD